MNDERVEKLEAEYKMLKADNDELKSINNYIHNLNVRLQSENENLQTQLEQYKAFAADVAQYIKNYDVFVNLHKLIKDYNIV